MIAAAWAPAEAKERSALIPSAAVRRRGHSLREPEVGCCEGVRVTERSRALERLIEAYGGEDRWRSARHVEATVWLWGFALAMKMKAPLRAVEVEVLVRRPLVRMRPPHWNGVVGVLEGQTCRLENGQGAVIAKREDPRSRFPYGRRSVWWDRLDQVYFTGFTLWNSLAFPAILMRSDVECLEVGPSILEVTFPADLPTHCETQRFYLDPATGRLLRQTYTVEVFGPWARASNVVLEHAAWDDLAYPCRLRVTPRGPGDRPLPLPRLVDVEVSGWRLL